MTQTLNRLRVFRWRAASHFCAGFFVTLGGGYAASNEATTPTQWVFVVAAALGAGWLALKALLDDTMQAAEGDKPKTRRSLPLGPLAVFVVFGLAVAQVFLMTSCASGGTRRAADTALARVVVQYATVKVLQQNPAHAPRVIALCAMVRTIAGGEKASTVGMLMEVIRAAIDWRKLDPADALLVQVLLEEIEQRLLERVGAGPFDGTGLLRVGEVTAWIEQAASAAAPATL